MNDISLSRLHADTQPSPIAPALVALSNGHSIPNTPVDDEEESSTIKCICGYQEDDGFTVFCEKCNTWQHIVCYYENKNNVPDVHECTDCTPRYVSKELARARQIHQQTEKERQERELHELHNLGERKIKKTAPKNSKKKIKEPSSTAAQLNGWPLDKIDPFQQERKSGSPRDLPPAKRHKTSHKASPSVSSINATRKRVPSSVPNGHSPVKSPVTPLSNGQPTDYFSPEFLQLYRGDEPLEITANTHSDEALEEELKLWLEDPDVLAEVTNGKGPTEIFQRLPTTIDELEATTPKINKVVSEEVPTDSVGFSDTYPIWQWLVADGPIEEGNYVGELRGHLERKPAYQTNESNRWQTLRHPEPFVFFPPHLPIVIDSRKQGSQMRYLRRSCDPNLEMRIFITDHDGLQFHFCFVARKYIDKDEPLTIKWDMDQDITRYIITDIQNGNVAEKGIQNVEQLSRWCGTALANFGGCACQKSPMDCLLKRAQSQNSHQPGFSDLSVRKAARQKKTKKNQISPISTGHATNSRAASEVNNHHDDEILDTRSASGSSRSKQESRDNTPMTAHSANDGLSNSEPLDRETRKLMQSYRLFEQQEHEESHGQKRKKRNSGGSTLNTPSVATSKQLGHLESSPPVSKTRVSSKPNMRKRPVIQRQKEKPQYTDACTQTETICLPVRPRKPYVSNVRALLNRAREERLQREERRAASVQSSAPPSPATAPFSPSSKASSSPVQDFKSSTTSAASDIPIKEDIEMQDVEALPVPATTPSGEATTVRTDVSVAVQAEFASKSPSQPPRETTHSTDSSDRVRSPSETPSLKPLKVQVDLPPAPDLSSQTASTPPTTTPGSTGPFTASSIAQSPSAAVATPVLPPSVTSAVEPSPVRKKLSLSAYTSRKAKAQAAANAGKPSSTSAEAVNALNFSNNESAQYSTPKNEPNKDIEMKDASSPSSPPPPPAPVADMGPPKAPASHPPPPLFS